MAVAPKGRPRDRAGQQYLDDVTGAWRRSGRRRPVPPPMPSPGSARMMKAWKAGQASALPQLEAMNTIGYSQGELSASGADTEARPLNARGDSGSLHSDFVAEGFRARAEMQLRERDFLFNPCAMRSPRNHMPHAAVKNSPVGSTLLQAYVRPQGEASALPQRVELQVNKHVINRFPPRAMRGPLLTPSMLELANAIPRRPACSPSLCHSAPHPARGIRRRNDTERAAAQPLETPVLEVSALPNDASPPTPPVTSLEPAHLGEPAEVEFDSTGTCQPVKLEPALEGEGEAKQTLTAAVPVEKKSPFMVSKPVHPAIIATRSDSFPWTSPRRNSVVAVKSPEDPAAARAQAVKTVFKKLADDGTVHKDDMPTALDMLGYVPVLDWIHDAFAGVTKFAVVKLEDFAFCVSDFDKRQRMSYIEAFNSADSDGSGSVATDELALLLRSFGIEPMAHVLAEVIQEVDANQSGTVDLDEFFVIMEIIQSREGFSQHDYHRIMSAFRRFDVDSSGEVETLELLAILTYLGHSTTSDQARAILAEVDVDGGGSLNVREFLMCMRKVRDQEIVVVKAAMAASDKDVSGTVAADELRELLHILGYFPSREAVADVGADCGILLDAELDLSALWQFLLVFRAREGLSRGDVDDVRATFDRFLGGGGLDDDDVGATAAVPKLDDAEMDSATSELDLSELDMALRWLGYVFPFELLRLLTNQVDTNSSGKLNVSEFLKLARICWEREVQVMQKTFASFDVFGTGVLPKAEAREALRAGGCVDGHGEPPSLRGDLGLVEFIDYSARQREVARRARRAQCGFSPDELQHLLVLFDNYDADSSGTIAHREMSSLLEGIFPDMAADARLRPELLALINDIGASNSDGMDFQCFLKLMRRCTLMQSVERLSKERQATAECSFSRREIEEFRKQFLQSDLNGNGELNLKEFSTMISAVCPMGDRNLEALRARFAKITCRQCRVEGQTGQADFPEFLWLFQWLLDDNFGGIRERSATIIGSTTD